MKYITLGFAAVSLQTLSSFMPGTKPLGFVEVRRMLRGYNKQIVIVL